jgi:hypothetical protein
VGQWLDQRGEELRTGIKDLFDKIEIRAESVREVVQGLHLIIDAFARVKIPFLYAC